jgi:hypothetical protein
MIEETDDDAMMLVIPLGSLLVVTVRNILKSRRYHSSLR